LSRGGEPPGDLDRRPWIQRLAGGSEGGGRRFSVGFKFDTRGSGSSGRYRSDRGDTGGGEGGPTVRGSRHQRLGAPAPPHSRRQRLPATSSTFPLQNRRHI
jgi:hypothetical protein